MGEKERMRHVKVGGHEHPRVGGDPHPRVGDGCCCGHHDHDILLGVTRCPECHQKFSTAFAECPYCHPSPEQEKFWAEVRKMMNHGIEP